MLLCAICAASVSLISLTSSQIYRKEPFVTSELMSFVSFIPGFVFGSIGAFHLPLHFNSGILAALFIKNILYCLSFYFRYESLRKYGPFVGALMLGTQPIIIFLLGLILLGESLTSTQMFSMVTTAFALLLLATDGKRTIGGRLSFIDFGKYYILPTLASTLAIIWDRYFLRGQISGGDFFILDRLTLIPAFLLAIVLIKRNKFAAGLWQKNYTPILFRNWKLFSTIGLLFTISVYTYNLALTLEKVALVGLFRNAAYPIAAFLGAFLFKQKISSKQWISLSLIFLAILLGAS